MKAALTGLLILSVMLGLCLFFSRKTANDLGSVAGLMEKCESGAESGEWASALECYEEALARWEASSLFFMATVRRDRIDEARFLLESAGDCVRRGDYGGFRAVNAALRAKLVQITDAESLSLSGLL